MHFRRLDRDNLVHEYGADGQRLLPFPELNSPFEGAYAVVRPGTATTPHSHHEYEMFIAVKGEAVLESGGRREPFRAGDVVHFPPHHEHQVINESEKDFEFFSVWWDEEMTHRFQARHGKIEEPVT
jgi:mannose-6-phosphate isomerase-like protein (cupin superfamily)